MNTFGNICTANSDCLSDCCGANATTPGDSITTCRYDECIGHYQEFFVHITIVFGFMLLVTIIFYCLVYRKVNSLQERYKVQEQQDRVGYQAKQ